MFIIKTKIRLYQQAIERNIADFYAYYCLACFSFGVLLHLSMPVLLANWHGILLFALAIIICWRRRVFLLLFWLVSGFVWALIHSNLLLQFELPSKYEGRDMLIVGKIASIPEYSHRHVSFDFRIEKTPFQKFHVFNAPTVKLRYYGNQYDINSNQKWEWVVRLKSPHGFQNPMQSFDYETYLFKNRFRASGYVRDDQQNKQLKHYYKLWSPLPFRERLSEFIHPPNSQELTPFLAALSVGDRKDISSSQWDVLRKTGTTHLMAISGLHIGLVAGMVFYLGGAMWRLAAGRWMNYIPAQHVGSILGFIAAAVYTVLAGMTIPTQRAFIMVGVLSFCFLTRRFHRSFLVLLLAFSIVLLFDPLAPLSPGFWLSFFAVAVLFWLSRVKKRSDKNWFYWFFIVQFWLSLALAPVLAIFFQEFTLLAPIANLVAIPVVAILMIPLVLTGSLLYVFSAKVIAQHLFSLSLWLFERLFWFLEWLSKLEFGVFNTSIWRWWQYMFFGIAVLFVIKSSNWKLRLGAPVIAGFIVMSKPSLAPLPAGYFNYTMFDIGNGLASVVQTQNHTMVYDAGPRYSDNSDAAKVAVIPYLQKNGVKKIDTMVISHEHQDHSGGELRIRNNYQIDNILSGAPQRISGSEKCYAGQNWEWSQVSFRVLWPNKSEHSDGNNSSCVILVTGKAGSLLLTGDIESKAEAKLVKKYKLLLQADVLQVPHQGSKSSSTKSFLKAVNPSVAMISAGYINAYRHPHPSVVRRFEHLGSEIYNTAYHGALEAKFMHDEIQIIAHRNLVNRYWVKKTKPSSQ